MTDRKINRHNFKLLFRKVRSFWNEYDPIGVMNDADWPRDEYDQFALRTLTLLNQRATIDEHCAHLKHCYERMGIEFVNEDAQGFAKKLRSWWFNRLNGEWRFGI